MTPFKSICFLTSIAVFGMSPSARAAPDELALGKLFGYPKGSFTTLFANPVGSFSAMDEILPSRLVAKADSVSEFSADAMPKVEYTFEGKSYSINDYLDRHRVTSFLVVKDGKLLLERYQYGRNERHRFASQSISKSITSLLVGIALDRGFIKSLDDTAATYAPDFAGSPYGDTTIRNLLRMSSGVAWVEDYSGNDDAGRLWNAMFAPDGGDVVRLLTSYRSRESSPGTRFRYSGAETAVLCHVLRGATKRDVASITEEWLWKPMGAEGDATWLVGKSGIEFCTGGFNATARDYARLGRLLANDGAWGGSQIIPKAYLYEATDHSVQPVGFRLNDVAPSIGYGYQFWLGGRGGRNFALQGIYGQWIFVAPTLGLTIVQTGVWSKPFDKGAFAERQAVMNAIRSAVSQPAK
jgi:CubicO group peptidase (beta-lactamase class C family)